MNKIFAMLDFLYKPFCAVLLVLFTLVESQAQTGDWVSVTPSNTPRWVGHSVMIKNKMYVFSGFDEKAEHTTEKCEVYDPQTNQWVYLMDMPTPVTHAGIAVDGDKVYIAGGFTGLGTNSNLLQIYDVASNTWSQGPVLPVPSGGNALVRVGRKLYSFGGLQQDRQTGALTHFVLDLDEPAKGWMNAAPLPEPRCHFAAATLGGKIYALGGQLGHDGLHTDVKYVHVYDPATDNWNRLNDMPYVRSHSETGTFVLDGEIILTGGKGGGETLLKTVTAYNPATDTWRELAPLPFEIFGPGAEVIGNELIVSNGSYIDRSSPQVKAWKRSITRSPQYKIGFAPTLLKLSTVAGGSLSRTAILWSLGSSPSYSIDVASLPAWLQVNQPSGSLDAEAGTEIDITADATGLAPGSYSALVRAQAAGHPDAQLAVELEVKASKPRILYLYGSMPPGLHDMKLSDTGARGMSEFSTAVQELGFALTESLDANISLDQVTLAPYKVLILGSNNRRFSEAEKLAVNNWVKAGGGLVAWSDAAFGYAVEGANTTVSAQSDNDLMQQFGMQFLRDNGVAVFTLKQWAEDHYINRFNKEGGLTIEAEGASPIRTTAPATILASLPPMANKLNDLDGPVTTSDAALSVAKIDQGRVLAVFDRNTFWNAGEGTQLSRADNRIFAQRLLLWASGVDDTEPPMPPVVAAPVSDFTVLKNSPPSVLDLSNVFTDKGSTANLSLSLTGNSNPAVVAASLENNRLTLSYTPDALGVSEITIRAMDTEGLWVEDKFVVTVSATEIKPAETAVYRINAGGIKLTNSLGTFSPDTYYNGGHVFSVDKPILGTNDPAMYQTERVAAINNGSFTYNIPVSNGQYKVVLHFADLYWHAEGKRVFDVTMEGSLVLDNYDIYKKTGQSYTATSENMIVNVGDGSLDIVFSALAGEGGVNRPKVSAIEVFTLSHTNKLPVANAGIDQTIMLPTSSYQLNGSGTDADGTISSYTWSQVSGPAIAKFTSTTARNPTVGGLVEGTYVFRLVVKDNMNGVSVADEMRLTVHPNQAVASGPAVFQVNAGGTQLSTSMGSFAADGHYAGGNVYSSKNAIAGTEDDALYQTERYASTANGTLNYSFPLSNGQYKVVLHFAELYWSAAGQRVFDIKAEGALMFDNYDIVKKTGTNFTATTESLVISVTDGNLDLLLSSLSTEGGVDRPKVSAIEIYPVTQTNNMPVANAGPDKTITLPTNSVTLTGSGSDSDGTISSYSWSQTSGPSTATLLNANTSSLTANDLVAGTYVFRLTVVDNNGGTVFDEAIVTVNGASSTGQSVVSYTLINATNNQEIRTLVSGETLNLATLPSQYVNIRANTNPVTVGSVKFALSGAQSRNVIESGAPYALFGDNGGIFYAWKPALGSYTLMGTPYTSSGGGGTAGTPLTITFNVINQAVEHPVVHRVNAGGAALTTLMGTAFAADANYDGGNVYSSKNAIAGTDDDALYQTERYSSAANGSLGYSFPVNNGEYKVVLHFAELYWSSAGKRVFDVKAEGVLMLDNYDIVKKTGASYTATTETLLVTVSDQKLDLLLSAVSTEGGVDRPKISAIEIMPATQNQPPTADAGADKTITLPTNSLTLTGSAYDADGTISSYSWTQTSGPSTATLSNASTNMLTASDLVAGSYVFRLTVSDNSNGKGWDEVTVTVNTSSSSTQALVSYSLINAVTNQVIHDLVEGETLNLATLPTKELNIRANTNPATVGSVQMALSGPQAKTVTESGAPYALFGDNAGDYYSWIPPTGTYTLKGTPFSGGGGSGTAGTSLTITFQVINEAPAARVVMPQQETSLVSLPIRVFPNPVTNGKLKVALPEPIEGDITYELSTITGLRLAKGKLQLDRPASVLDLNFSQQMTSSGMYLLKLSGKNLHARLKIIRE